MSGETATSSTSDLRGSSSPSASTVSSLRPSTPRSVAISTRSRSRSRSPNRLFEEFKNRRLQAAVGALQQRFATSIQKLNQFEEYQKKKEEVSERETPAANGQTRAHEEAATLQRSVMKPKINQPTTFNRTISAQAQAQSQSQLQSIPAAAVSVPSATASGSEPANISIFSASALNSIPPSSNVTPSISRRSSFSVPFHLPHPISQSSLQQLQPPLPPPIPAHPSGPMLNQEHSQQQSNQSRMHQPTQSYPQPYPTIQQPQLPPAQPQLQLQPTHPYQSTQQFQPQLQHQVQEQQQPLLQSQPVQYQAPLQQQALPQGYQHPPQQYYNNQHSQPPAQEFHPIGSIPIQPQLQPQHQPQPHYQPQSSSSPIVPSLVAPSANDAAIPSIPSRPSSSRSMRSESAQPLPPQIPPVKPMSTDDAVSRSQSRLRHFEKAMGESKHVPIAAAPPKVAAEPKSLFADVKPIGAPHLTPSALTVVDSIPISRPINVVPSQHSGPSRSRSHSRTRRRPKSKKTTDELPQHVARLLAIQSQHARRVDYSSSSSSDSDDDALKERMRRRRAKSPPTPASEEERTIREYKSSPKPDTRDEITTASLVASLASTRRSMANSSRIPIQHLAESALGDDLGAEPKEFIDLPTPPDYVHQASMDNYQSQPMPNYLPSTSTAAPLNTANNVTTTVVPSQQGGQELHIHLHNPAVTESSPYDDRGMQSVTQVATLPYANPSSQPTPIAPLYASSVQQLGPSHSLPVAPTPHTTWATSNEDAIRHHHHQQQQQQQHFYAQQHQQTQYQQLRHPQPSSYSHLQPYPQQSHPSQHAHQYFHSSESLQPYDSSYSYQPSVPHQQPYLPTQQPQSWFHPSHANERDHSLQPSHEPRPPIAQENEFDEVLQSFLQSDHPIPHQSTRPSEYSTAAYPAFPSERQSIDNYHFPPKLYGSNNAESIITTVTEPYSLNESSQRKIHPPQPSPFIYTQSIYDGSSRHASAKQESWLESSFPMSSSFTSPSISTSMDRPVSSLYGDSKPARTFFQPNQHSSIDYDHSSRSSNDLNPAYNRYPPVLREQLLEQSRRPSTASTFDHKNDSHHPHHRQQQPSQLPPDQLFDSSSYSSPPRLRRSRVATSPPTNSLANSALMSPTRLAAYLHHYLRHRTQVEPDEKNRDPDKIQLTSTEASQLRSVLVELNSLKSSHELSREGQKILINLPTCTNANTSGARRATSKSRHPITLTESELLSASSSRPSTPPSSSQLRAQSLANRRSEAKRFAEEEELAAVFVRLAEERLEAKAREKRHQQKLQTFSKKSNLDTGLKSRIPARR